MMRRGFGLLITAVVATGCGDDGAAPRAATTTPTLAHTASATATATAGDPVATHTLTPPATGTVPPTATLPLPTATVPIPTATGTPVDTPTPAPTATPMPPEIVFFGVARADDLVQQPDGIDEAGRPIYMRAQGQGMTLVVEGRRGRLPLVNETYDPVNFAPGVEIIVSRPLGDGSAAVCDYDPPLIGGVPAVEPLQFRDDQMVRDAVADLGCRFNDGTGSPQGRNANNACTRDLGALFSFVDSRTELQYCLPIAKAWAFPPGDTIVAARVRDVGGSVSEVHELVIRVPSDQPFACDTGLGERVFTVQLPASAVVASGGYGRVSGDGWVTAPLRLCAGPDLGDGTHALTLRENARFGIPLIGGLVVCAEFRSRGSAGVLDCGNSTPQDVLAVAALPSGRITVDTGLGVPAGTGAASLRLPVAVRVLSSGSPRDCLDTSYDITAVDAFTTATATAEVRDEQGAVLTSLTHAGAPFSCAQWTFGGSPVLVLPVPVTLPTGDYVAASLVLFD
jgi:hypothetical protein